MKSGVSVHVDLAAEFNISTRQRGDAIGPRLKWVQERGDPIANVRRFQKRRELLPADWAIWQCGVSPNHHALIATQGTLPRRSPPCHGSDSQRACFYRIRMGLGVNELAALRRFTVPLIAKLGGLFSLAGRDSGPISGFQAVGAGRTPAPGPNFLLATGQARGPASPPARSLHPGRLRCGRPHGGFDAPRSMLHRVATQKFLPYRSQ